jgi:hypothetical protein
MRSFVIDPPHKELGTMDTQLLARLPVEQARCRELARQYSALGSIGCFAAAMIEDALQRADRAIIDGDEMAIRRALHELQAHDASRQPPVRLAAPPAPVQRPTLAIAVPPVGRRPGRFAHAAAA